MSLLPCHYAVFIHKFQSKLMTYFNLNADMAEGYGIWTLGDDEALLAIVNSANIACGFHGGDHNIMPRVMKAAHQRGVSIGAHPGFYDLHGFGRRPMNLSLNEIENLIAYQLGAAQAMASLVGADISHVKPHGALNNMAAADLDMALAIARAIKAVDPSQILLAPALSCLITAGEKLGLQIVSEVFADRSYMPDGQLTPRNRPDAMITCSKQALENCLMMLQEGRIIAIDGTQLDVQADSICVHGDGETALTMATKLKDGLEEAGLQGATLPQIITQS